MTLIWAIAALCTLMIHTCWRLVKHCIGRERMDAADGVLAGALLIIAMAMTYLLSMGFYAQVDNPDYYESVTTDSE